MCVSLGKLRREQCADAKLLRLGQCAVVWLDWPLSVFLIPKRASKETRTGQYGRATDSVIDGFGVQGPVDYLGPWSMSHSSTDGDLPLICCRITESGRAVLASCL